MNDTELLEELNRAHPDAIPLPLHILVLLHDDDLNVAQYIIQAVEQLDNYICYYLPAGEYSAQGNNCCNGIRYGKDGDYISLPHIDYQDIVNTFVH